jgi:hypothetical protein
MICGLSDCIFALRWGSSSSTFPLYQVSVYVQFLKGFCTLSELRKATRLPEMRLKEYRVSLLIDGYSIRI